MQEIDRSIADLELFKQKDANFNTGENKLQYKLSFSVNAKLQILRFNLTLIINWFRMDQNFGYVSVSC